MAADLILKSNAIFTSTGDDTFAGAVAVQGNKIVYVGPAEGAEAFKGLRYPRAGSGRQDGRPGFHDSHLHFSSPRCTAAPTWCSARAAASRVCKRPGSGGERAQ